jgi:formate dehydrogenase subunit gamma
VTTATYRRASPTTLLRFDVVQRSVHWVNALLFGVLIVTGIPLYFGSLLGVVFPRHTIQMIHLFSGLVLPLPVLVSLLGPWGRRMRADLSRCSDWTHAEIRWLRSFGRTKLVADKYNPGQKANAIFVGAAIVVLFASGYVLQWFRFFPVSWRTGATLTHDLFAFGVFAAIVGHVFMAVTHPTSLRSMFTGTVSEDWAVRHAEAWLAEEHRAAGH